MAGQLLAEDWCHRSGRESRATEPIFTYSRYLACVSCPRSSDSADRLSEVNQLRFVHSLGSPGRVPAVGVA
jgi:hypothetical protein